MSGIHFATFNIGGGVPYRETSEFSGKAFHSVSYLSSLIAEHQLDIVCFQEVLMGDEKHNSMSGEIAKKSDLKFYTELSLSDSHIVVGRKMGISIISKYPFVQSEAFMLENPGITKVLKSGEIYYSHDKGFLISRIQTDAGELCCATGHCFPFHSFRRDVMDFKYIYEKLEQKLLKLSGENSRIIIGADFNTSRLALLMPELCKRYRSLVNVPTRPNGRRDDYILCDREHTNAEFRLIKTCYDHYGCMCIYR